MNFWGFHPAIFDQMEHEFEIFLKSNQSDPTAEFFIAYPLDRGLRENQFSIRVLKSNERWMGVTYQKDKALLQTGIQEKISEGIYPISLYES